MASKGYTCEKALRIDHYQNATGRLTAPLRREQRQLHGGRLGHRHHQHRGAFRRIGDTNGTNSLFYYEGGGQGNPWHSHGFDETRRVLKQIANDENSSMIVIDPRRTETAELADNTVGGDAVIAELGRVDVADFARRCGVDVALLRSAARRAAAADSVAILEDLGIEMAPNSTLVSPSRGDRGVPQRTHQPRVA